MNAIKERVGMRERRAGRGVTMAVIAALIVAGIAQPAQPAGALAGAGWYAQASGTSVFLNDVAAGNALTAWAAGPDGALVKTSDGGDTWETQDPGTDADLCQVSAVDALTAWIAGGRVIVHTSDGGASWTVREMAAEYGDIKTVSAVSRDVAWVGGESGALLRTLDGGATWQPKDPLGAELSVGALDAVDADVAWATLYEASDARTDIVRTSDGGASWQTLRSFRLDQGGTPRAISAVDARTAWVAGTLGIILKTSDGGLTWSEQTASPRAFYDIAAADSDSAWVVGQADRLTGEASCLKTSDGGETWGSQLLPVAGDLGGIAVAGPAIAWAVGAGGAIAHTVDGGGPTLSSGNQ
ncbi:MAG: WD40/YVTN/BNR-like repeat-containing protein, partial [Candidatus Geothermincolia bacterium]